VLLEDDEGMLAADNILPILTTELNDVEGLADLANAVSAALTTENVTEMNRKFDVETEDADAVAAEFLADAGLL
jgi:osmoprotectant transport system substrate-binding protein